MWGESNSCLGYAKLLQWLVETEIGQKAAVRLTSIMSLSKISISGFTLDAICGSGQSDTVKNGSVENAGVDNLAPRCRDGLSDVKRGQNLEAETEARALRSRPRPRPIS